MPVSGEAVMEKVRRYRAVASLWRQTATFRPDQRWSLLEQAERWEKLAVAELETYFKVRNSADDHYRQLRVATRADAEWEMLAAA
jgi:hypothetical protein